MAKPKTRSKVTEAEVDERSPAEVVTSRRRGNNSASSAQSQSTTSVSSSRTSTPRARAKAPSNNAGAANNRSNSGSSPPPLVGRKAASSPAKKKKNTGTKRPRVSARTSAKKKAKKGVGSASGGAKHEARACEAGQGCQSRPWEHPWVRIHKTAEGKVVRMLIVPPGWVDYIVCPLCRTCLTWGTAAKHECSESNEQMKEEDTPMFVFDEVEGCMEEIATMGNSEETRENRQLRAGDEILYYPAEDVAGRDKRKLKITRIDPSGDRPVILASTDELLATTRVKKVVEGYPDSPPSKKNESDSEEPTPPPSVPVFTELANYRLHVGGTGSRRDGVACLRGLFESMRDDHVSRCERNARGSGVFLEDAAEVIGLKRKRRRNRKV